jgi:hypothetical protein
MAGTCGHCKRPEAPLAHIRECAALEHEARRLGTPALSRAKVAATNALVVTLGTPTPERFPCESGPAGIGCHMTGIPGTAGTGWNGQRFTNLFTCPRCHGKGYENAADRKRNLFHDDRYMAERIMADFR